MPSSGQLSGIVDSILDAHPHADRLTFQEIVDHLGPRAYGALLILFAIPNAIPNIPGSGLLSAPLLPIAIQMMRGRLPWLPARLARRPITRAALERLRDRTSPWLRRADCAVRPRWPWMTSRRSERVLGAYVAVLAFVLMLPIPLANMFPSWAVVALGVGVLERDGAWVLGGAAWGLVALTIAFLVVLTATSLAVGALS